MPCFSFSENKLKTEILLHVAWIKRGHCVQPSGFLMVQRNLKKRQNNSSQTSKPQNVVRQQEGTESSEGEYLIINISIALFTMKDQKRDHTTRFQQLKTPVLCCWLEKGRWVTDNLLRSSIFCPQVMTLFFHFLTLSERRQETILKHLYYENLTFVV